jgi:uncharacterized repeat protein (TIGR01451 family)
MLAVISKQMKYITLLLAFLSVHVILNAQEIQWQHTIGGNNRDQLFSIQQTADGGYIFGGNSMSDSSFDKTENSRGGRDYWIVKTDSMGNILWQKTLGGSGSDYLHYVHQTSDGGYILGGESDSGISGEKTAVSHGVYDLWILKLDSLRNIEWQKSIGGNALDYFGSMESTMDGGYIIGGYSQSDSSGDKTENAIGGLDYWILKIDSAGNIQWQNTIGGAGLEYLVSIHQTADSGFIVGGYSDSQANGDKTEISLGQEDYWIVRLDRTGNILWQNTIGGNLSDKLSALEITYDGGYILSGTSLSNISGDKTENSILASLDYWVVKTDSLGQIQWQKTIGGDNSDIATSIHNTLDGGYFICGYSKSNISADKTEDCLGLDDYWIMKSDSAGNIKWSNTIGGDSIDYLTSALEIRDGQYIIGGFSYSGISGDKSELHRGMADFWIALIADKLNEITGKLYFDINNNSIYDQGDIVKINHQISDSVTGRVTFTGPNGNYRLDILDTGNFVVSPASVPNFNTLPARRNIYFPGYRLVDTSNHFALQPASIFDDLKVEIFPVTNFRGGFDAKIVLHYQNNGTTVTSPEIVFKPGLNMHYLNASVNPNNITPDSVLWNIPLLAPFQEGIISIEVGVDFSATMGTLLFPIASISPVSTDINPADNFSTYAIPVTASYDPNNILVDHQTLNNTDLIIGTYLDYSVNFQNTGTDTAINVRINNPIPQNTIPSSIEILGSSHPVTINYLNQDHTLWFQFDNIMLPDSNADETMSHGYVHYRIKPVSNVTTGDSILNKAYIYFDLNQPVTTNTAVTVINLSTDINSTTNTDIFSVFPNPAKSDIRILYSLDKPAHINLSIYDVTGKEIKSFGKKIDSTGNHEFVIADSDLANGLFEFVLSVDGEIHSKKLLKIN